MGNDEGVDYKSPGGVINCDKKLRGSRFLQMFSFVLQHQGNSGGFFGGRVRG